MVSGIEIGFLLDHRWHLMRSEPIRSKKESLLALGTIFAEADVPYAIIGGVALQAHQADPRTTLDIYIALPDRSALPRAPLEAAGFRATGSYAHSDNWVGPDGTPVQFSDDAVLGPAIARAESHEIDGVTLRVIGRRDLLHAKLRAAVDPARRRSKRFQDLGDAQSLLDDDPAAAEELTPEELALLQRLP